MFMIIIMTCLVALWERGGWLICWTPAPGEVSHNTRRKFHTRKVSHNKHGMFHTIHEESFIQGNFHLHMESFTSHMWNFSLNTRGKSPQKAGCFKDCQVMVGPVSDSRGSAPATIEGRVRSVLSPRLALHKTD